MNIKREASRFSAVTQAHLIKNITLRGSQTARSMSTSIVLLTVAVTLLQLVTDALAEERKIPDFIHICKRHQADLNDCITASVMEVQPKLVEGVPGFIPSLEPLLMREVVASEGSGIRIVGKDVKAYGASNFEVFNMKASQDDLTYEFDLKFPLLYVDATYQVDGRILLIPIKGNGPLKGNFSDCTAHVKLQGALTEKNGKQYPHFTGLTINLDVGQGKLHLDNLFGGEKVLGDVVNNAINSNFNQFLNELRRPIERALEDALLEIANNVVDGFTYDQLFPED